MNFGIEAASVLLLIIFSFIISLMKLEGNLKNIIVFITSLSYILVVRFSHYDADMLVYYGWISSDTSSFNIDYALKEPFFLYLSPHINSYLSNYSNISIELTFLLYDALCLLLVMIALNTCKYRELWICAYLLFPPVFLGYQNIYRQYIAMSFLMPGLMLLLKGDKKSIYFLLLSGMSHNSTLLFFPLVSVLFLNKVSNSIKTIFILFIIIPILIVGLKFGLETNTSNTGFDLALPLTIVSFLLSLIILAISRLDLTGYTFVFYCMLTCLLSYFFGSSSAVERVNYMVFATFLVFISNNVNNLKIVNIQKQQVYIPLFLIFLEVVMLFSVSSLSRFIKVIV